MLKKVTWDKHPILGNLELDFLKPSGGIYNSIILAGENGSGKTTILDTLSTFLNLGSIEPFKQIEYVIDNNSYTIIQSETKELRALGFHNRIDTSGIKTQITSNHENGRETIKNDPLDIRHYGCVYSKARTGFSTRPIKTTTTEQLDDNKYENDTNEDFTSIKQLIVDVSAQDDATFRRHFNSMIDKTQSEISDTFKPISKMERFTSAFNAFFENMEFSKVDNESRDEKRVLFMKNGIEVLVDALSTGEKQVVFRGAHLLKNSANLIGGVVLIDEPELSMHPKWQEKILQYYRNLFKKEDSQMAQIIFATHSDYILRAGLEDNDNVLIMVLSEESGMIRVKRVTAPTVLPSITSAEVNYVAFGIASNDYHIELYGHLQNKENKKAVKACDDFIANHQLYNSGIHSKPSTYAQTQYTTLPTYIRNAIDHPDPSRTFTQSELEVSIKLLIELCR
ncbi:MAG: ATP-binding protein [Desulfuromonadales bacterium]|nr:ATP-binding protein [Desulfuromonadales bacterium]